MDACELSARFFFFNDPATTEIYTLSLHDALPIYDAQRRQQEGQELVVDRAGRILVHRRDRKSTRLNSSHVEISYAVFCLKKKIKNVIGACVITTYSNGIM